MNEVSARFLSNVVADVARLRPAEQPAGMLRVKPDELRHILVQNLMAIGLELAQNDQMQGSA